MHPFCLGLATTSARAALRLKAGRQPLCQRPSHAPHFWRAVFHSNVSRLQCQQSHTLSVRCRAARGRQPSWRSPRAYRVESPTLPGPGSELSRPSSTNQNSKPRNKSLTIRPATVCRRTELMIEKRARRMARNALPCSRRCAKQDRACPGIFRLECRRPIRGRRVSQPPTTARRLRQEGRIVEESWRD